MRGPDAGLDIALDRARSGDPRGFDALFRAYADSLARYLRGRGVRDPEGLANEVFLRAFRNVRSVEGDAERFRVWLFRVARNAAVDDYRRRCRQCVETPLTAVTEVANDADVDVTVALEVAAIRELFAQLSPDQCDVLTLRVLGDLTLTQTADVLGKSCEAVKALQHRAVVNVRRLLESSEAVST